MIKQDLLNINNIVKTNDNYYRYIDHNLKFATCGFNTKEGLLRNTDIIRIDYKTIETMKKRYIDLFPTQ
jgi:hypothetical protein